MADLVQGELATVRVETVEEFGPKIEFACVRITDAGCGRWLPKCGAAQTGPRAAQALTDPQWSCPMAGARLIAQSPSCRSPERATDADVGFMRGPVHGWPVSCGPGPY
jgi:hypothetical protein